eukprot:TRINITY_DN2408_c0_g1_i1.p3 TRINITY_DN2408_c0_g1~~TRINITY_DN2408_c0_g1_i1.p3  ORF type:complete len:118 (+),score=17.39 TRINITY_DN2408_c0_g1_i1:599-952(+)
MEESSVLHRIKKVVTEGLLSAACGLFNAPPLAPFDENVTKKIRDLYSDEPEPTPSELFPQPARINDVLAVNVLKSFKKGAVGSLTGLRLQHVIDVFDAFLYTPISNFLANLLNLMAG